MAVEEYVFGEPGRWPGGKVAFAKDLHFYVNWGFPAPGCLPVGAWVPGWGVGCVLDSAFQARRCPLPSRLHCYQPFDHRIPFWQLPGHGVRHLVSRIWPRPRPWSGMRPRPGHSFAHHRLLQTRIRVSVIVLRSCFHRESSSLWTWNDKIIDGLRKSDLEWHWKMNRI